MGDDKVYRASTFAPVNIAVIKYVFLRSPVSLNIPSYPVQNNHPCPSPKMETSLLSL